MDTFKLQQEIKSLIEKINLQFERIEKSDSLSAENLALFVEPIADLHKKAIILEHLSQNILAPQLVAETIPEVIIEEPIIIQAPEPVKEPEPIAEPEPEIVAAAPVVETPVIPEIIQETIPEPIVEAAQPIVIPEPIAATPKPTAKATSKMAISINDKFIFIKQLFNGDATAYDAGMQQMNAATTEVELKVVLTNLKANFHWDEENENVVKIKTLAEMRFV
jgi:hypothetical protein